MNSVQSEIWKDVSGYEGLYKVSNLGRIKSFYGWNGHKYVKQERLLKGWIQKARADGDYVRRVITLYKDGESKIHRIHKLVANEFVENPNRWPYVNHIDGNSLNNTASNLEWVTQSDNIKHAYITKARDSTYHNIERDELIKLLNNGLTYDDVAEHYGISKGTVFNIIKRLKINRIYM